jgi:tRNA(Ile)-lysidine synthase
MDTDMNFTDRFSKSLHSVFCKDGFSKEVAVAVSGGADSMALVHALAAYAPETKIHALTVDHRLREEAADEARFVGRVVGKLSNVSHHILVWKKGSEQDTRIEEKAREARYGLLFDFMGKKGIKYLFIGHHQNDQAETFLFRLAKGSGLDGLACMPSVSAVSYNDQNFVLCRPFLGEGKADILEYVSQANIPYIEDPSNQDDQFARVRLRKSMSVLSEEGLTPKRLGVTAKRIERAREAICYLVDREYKNVSYYMNTKTIVLKRDLLKTLPFEIVIRIVLKAMEALNEENGGYGPRLQRVENLCEDLMASKPFRKRTLGGVIFERDDNFARIVMLREKSR